MSTTEVVIEQVLTGFLVLAALLLPFYNPALAETFAKSDTGPLTLLGVAGAGIAYCLGVPADRFADSIMGGLEQRARLTFAWRVRGTRAGDPFPESALRTRMLQHGSAEVVAHMQYLRTRMRICRALAVYVPALTISAMLRLACASPATTTKALLALAVGYGVLAGVVSRNPGVPEVRERPDGKWEKLVSTAQLRPFIEATGRDQPDPWPVWRAYAARLDVAPWLLAVAFIIVLLLRQPQPWTVPSLTVLDDPTHGPLVAALLAGAMLTAVSGWSWWRTTATFNRFLHDFDLQTGGQEAEIS